MVEDRMMRWVMKKDFIDKNEQEAPEDVKFILAYYAVLLTIHQEAYNYDGLDRVVFYHHPFLTPHFIDDAHILELEKEDGSLIISVPHLLRPSRTRILQYRVTSDGRSLSTLLFQK